jgi:hypothetical protein
MITIEETARTVELQVDEFVIDDAQRAAVAFPARSSGRALDAPAMTCAAIPWAADGEPAIWRRPVRTSSAIASSRAG